MGGREGVRAGADIIRSENALEQVAEKRIAMADMSNILPAEAVKWPHIG